MAHEQDHFQRSLYEHRGCMKVLAEVESGLSLQPESEPGWRSKLVALLDDLDTALRAHFQGEEEGLFDKLALEHPRLAPKFKKLEEEHAAIIGTLRDAMQRAGNPGTASVTKHLHELNEQVKTLVATVRRHEALRRA